MTKNGEEVQSKVVAEVKQTTAAMFVAYNEHSQKVLWVGTYHARCRQLLN